MQDSYSKIFISTFLSLIRINWAKEAGYASDFFKELYASVIILFKYKYLHHEAVSTAYFYYLIMVY